MGQYSLKPGQYSPKIIQPSTQVGQHSPKTGQAGPKMGQHSPKMDQHGLQTGSTSLNLGAQTLRIHPSLGPRLDNVESRWGSAQNGLAEATQPPMSANMAPITGPTLPQNGRRHGWESWRRTLRSMGFVVFAVFLSCLNFCSSSCVSCPHIGHIASSQAKIAPRGINLAPWMGQPSPKTGQHSPKMGQHFGVTSTHTPPPPPMSASDIHSSHRNLPYTYESHYCMKKNIPTNIPSKNFNKNILSDPHCDITLKQNCPFLFVRSPDSGSSSVHHFLPTQKNSNKSLLCVISSQFQFPGPLETPRHPEFNKICSIQV